MEKNEARQALEALGHERETLPDRIGEAIDRAIAVGLTWRAIGAALGMTHAAAIKAHRRWKERT
jgi:hypothetical protein